MNIKKSKCTFCPCLASILNLSNFYRFNINNESNLSQEQTAAFLNKTFSYNFRGNSKSNSTIFSEKSRYYYRPESNLDAMILY